MSKILIVDHTPYQQILSDMFTNAGYTTISCDSHFEALAILSSEDISLALSEVDLPGGTSFEFYYYMDKNFPFIPVIMLTELDIDLLFDAILNEGIGNILHKPVNNNELLKLSEKLITKENLFGLGNYIDKPVEIQKINLFSSDNIRPAVHQVIKTIENWDLNIQDKTTLKLLLSEMSINAVYHSNGYTNLKLLRKPVYLPSNKSVEIYYGFGESCLGISIVDYNGNLSKMRILESINNVIVQDKLLLGMMNNSSLACAVPETGRGLEMLRQLANEYYFIIKNNVRTEVILLFNFGYDFGSRGASVKIIEVD